MGMRGGAVESDGRGERSACKEFDMKVNGVHQLNGKQREEYGVLERVWGTRSLLVEQDYWELRQGLEGAKILELCSYSGSFVQSIAVHSGLRSKPIR